MGQDGDEGAGTFGERGFDAVKDAVNAATEQFDKVGRHFKDKIDAKQPQAYIELLKDVTKSAPLGMLAVAFIGGMLFARPR
jgi:hypothetical protein